MTEKTDSDTPDAHQNLSEAERMARIRDLLVGPVIADESARRDESVGRLDQTLADQAEMITALQKRISHLEESQRVEAERQSLRFLGMVEALLTDEQGLRQRLARHDQLKTYLGGAISVANGAEKSG